MSTRLDSTRKGFQRVTRKEGPNLQSKTVVLNKTNQIITLTNSYSGGMSFEISNDAADLSGPATINAEISVSGKSWTQATDIGGDDITYTLASGSAIVDAISGIPEGTKLRLVLSGSVTGTLEVATRQ